jgi:hypothetical protein
MLSLIVIVIFILYVELIMEVKLGISNIVTAFDDKNGKPKTFEVQETIDEVKSKLIVHET